MDSLPTVAFEDIVHGNRVALSRAITLIESRKKQDQDAKYALLKQCLSLQSSSLRIGITGSPGVGKSTFIETLGLMLIEKGHKVAVLAVDPSSTLSGGSILGDKTRMEKLSAHPRAFIRPTPNAQSLGGIALKTRESIFLCEAAGYDIILIETVGVGQSEFEVKNMVDFLLMLVLPGSGDELQGFKRGIIEMADLIAINKADGQNIERARGTMISYKNALHLFRPSSNGWTRKAILCSALDNTGLDEIWESVISFNQQMKKNGFTDNNRKEQLAKWLDESIIHHLHDTFFQQDIWTKDRIKMHKNLQTQTINPIDAILALRNKIDQLYRQNPDVHE